MMGNSTRSALKVALAVTAFGIVHSALAADGTKRTFARVFGSRRRNALYRPLYNTIAVGSTGMLLTYAARQESKTIYDVRGSARYALRLGQLLTAFELVRALREIGFVRFSGVPNLVAWTTGETEIPIEPEGQGPSRSGERLHTNGPFRYSRHPLNALTILLLWLNPRLSSTGLALNLVSTVYLAAGSFHEESRLLTRYGDEYEEYLQSGTPFLGPAMPTTWDATSLS